MDCNRIKKNAHVVYGTNGLCLVENVCEMAFSAGEPQKTYFILRPIADRGSTIYIPHDNEILLSRLRPAFTEKQAKDLLAKGAISDMEWVEDRKQRLLSFREILQQNQPLSLLQLIQCIGTQRDALILINKKLSSADREILSDALRAVTEEFSFALALPRDEVVTQISQALSIELP